MNSQQMSDRHGQHGTRCPDQAALVQWVCDRESVAPDVSTHIADCAGCRKEAKAWQATVDAMQTLPQAMASPRLLENTMAALEPGRRTFQLIHFPQRYRTAVAVAAAAIALFAVTGIVWHDVQQRETRRAPLPGSINWLSKAQSPDGSWCPEHFGGKEIYTDALTGLSLMGLAEDVQGPSGRPPAGISRAVTYLLSSQQPDGRLGNVEGDAAMYNHTMAALGLTQALPLLAEGDRPALARALERATAYTLSQQQAGGGWGYARGDTRPPNMGVTSWAVQSLLRAREAGVENQTEVAVAHGVRWLAAQMQPAGTFSYQPQSAAQPATATLTAMGALCILQAGRSIAPPGLIAKMQKTLERVAPAEADDIYGRYLLACALDAAETERCGELLAQLRDAVAARRPDVKESQFKGWADGDRWAGTGGEVYATALAWLTLHIDPSGRVD